MANSVIGNSLFALLLELMHAPPMFVLRWMQRSLRRRMAVAAEPVPATRRVFGSSPAASSLQASGSRC